MVCGENIDDRDLNGHAVELRADHCSDLRIYCKQREVAQNRVATRQQPVVRLKHGRNGVADHVFNQHRERRTKRWRNSSWDTRPPKKLFTSIPIITTLISNSSSVRIVFVRRPAGGNEVLRVFPRRSCGRFAQSRGTFPAEINWNDWTARRTSSSAVATRCHWNTAVNPRPSPAQFPPSDWYPGRTGRACHRLRRALL